MHFAFSPSLQTTLDTILCPSELAQYKGNSPLQKNTTESKYIHNNFAHVKKTSVFREGLYYLSTKEDKSLAKGYAFESPKQQKIIVLSTGVGIAQMQGVLDSVLAQFHDAHCYFAGCALGISSQLSLGDTVSIKYAIQYDTDIPHDIESIASIITSILAQEKDNTSTSKAIALSGNIFIPVVQRRKLLTNDNGSIEVLDILPDSAKKLLEDIISLYPSSHKEDSNTSDKYPFSIVLDMETSVLFEPLFSSYFRDIIRVVIDTIYDDRSIAFEKEMASISIIIRDWFLSKLE